MRYVMKQMLLSWGDDVIIQDAEGRDAFFVDVGEGEDDALMPAERFTRNDPDGNIHGVMPAAHSVTWRRSAPR